MDTFTEALMANLVRTLEWCVKAQADWAMVQELMAYHAVYKGWCREYDITVLQWNRYLAVFEFLPRRGVDLPPDAGTIADKLRRATPTPDHGQPPLENRKLCNGS